MFTIFKTTELGLQAINEFEAGSWVNAVDPTPAEIAQLHEALSVPHDFLTYPLDADERPRTEKDEGVTLILLRIPYYQGETSDVPYATIPLGIILTDKLIITICRMKNDVTLELLNGRVKGLSTSKKNRLILQLLMSTALKYLRYLREINKTVDALEDELQLSIRNREVLGLLKFEKSLVYFTTALRSNELMLERLQRSRLFEMYPEDADLLEDVLTENQQAIEMTAIANNILSGMMDAFASIISNNLNGVMKFLTSMTIVLTLPTMIASIYGMNITLPLQTHPAAFLLVMAMAIGGSVLVALILAKKDWF